MATSMTPEEVQIALAALGPLNLILAEQVETLADEECLQCRNFPYQCHIWNNEGASLKPLHLHPETKACTGFQDKVEH
jgi:hypothetical protein